MNNLNIGHYEDLRPWNNNFMLRSGVNNFVSQILVQGGCVLYFSFKMQSGMEETFKTISGQKV